MKKETYFKILLIPCLITLLLLPSLIGSGRLIDPGIKFVPYSGATSNVDLGIYNFTTTGTSFLGNVDFNDGWLNGGLSIINGSIYAQVGYFYNITSLNVTRQNLTILDNLFVEGNATAVNFFGKFGDLVSEQNPDSANAIRLKGTSSDVDIVLGHGTGYFSVYNAVDTTAVFYVNDHGDTDIAGDLTVDTNTLFVNAANDRVGIGTASPSDKLEVNGNITAENVFLPVYVSSHTNNTIVVASAGVWYNITFDHEIDEFKKRITHTVNDDTNTTFTIIDDGIYEITYTMSFEDSATVPNSHIIVRVTKNNVELNGFTIETDLGIQNQDESLHHSDLVSLVAGDEIVLSFTSDDTTVSLSSHLTYGNHKNTGHLTIKRVA